MLSTDDELNLGSHGAAVAQAHESQVTGSMNTTSKLVSMDLKLQLEVDEAASRCVEQQKRIEHLRARMRRAQVRGEALATDIAGLVAKAVSADLDMNAAKRGADVAKKLAKAAASKSAAMNKRLAKARQARDRAAKLVEQAVQKNASHE